MFGGKKQKACVECTKRCLKIHSRSKCNNRREESSCFFKVMIGQFKSKLSIPHGFRRQIEHLINRTVLLEDYEGKTWTVRVAVVENSLAFLQGWKQFVEAKNIETGEFLVFKHLGGSIFAVEIFGPSGCARLDTKDESDHDTPKQKKQKTDSHEKKKQKRDSSNHLKHRDGFGSCKRNVCVINLVSDDEEESDECRQTSDIKPLPRSAKGSVPKYSKVRERLLFKAKKCGSLKKKSGDVFTDENLDEEVDIKAHNSTSNGLCAPHPVKADNRKGAKRKLELSKKKKVHTNGVLEASHISAPKVSAKENKPPPVAARKHPMQEHYPVKVGIGKCSSSHKASVNKRAANQAKSVDNGLKKKVKRKNVEASVNNECTANQGKLVDNGLKKKVEQKNVDKGIQKENGVILNAKPIRTDMPPTNHSTFSSKSEAETSVPVPDNCALLVKTDGTCVLQTENQSPLRISPKTKVYNKEEMSNCIDRLSKSNTNKGETSSGTDPLLGHSDNDDHGRCETTCKHPSPTMETGTEKKSTHVAGGSHVNGNWLSQLKSIPSADIFKSPAVEAKRIKIEKQPLLIHTVPHKMHADSSAYKSDLDLLRKETNTPQCEKPKHALITPKQEFDNGKCSIQVHRTTSNDHSTRGNAGWLSTYACCDDRNRHDVPEGNRKIVFRSPSFLVSKDNTRTGESRIIEKYPLTVKTEMELSSIEKPANPVIFSFTASGVGNPYLEIPSGLPFKTKGKEKRMVFLRDSSMRVWPVLHNENTRFTGFLSGWKEFARANQLRDGDACVLEMVSDSEPIYNVALSLS